MPTYEYLCPVHGHFEIVQSIKDPALTIHGIFNIGPFMKPAQEQRVGRCRRAVKRLISGGCGVIADAEKLYDQLPPRFPGDIREAKSDLARNRAKLIGIPREERRKFERLYY